MSVNVVIFLQDLWNFSFKEHIIKKVLINYSTVPFKDEEISFWNLQFQDLILNKYVHNKARNRIL